MLPSIRLFLILPMEDLALLFKFSKINPSYRMVITSMLGKEFQLKTDILYFVNLDNEITGAKVRIPAMLSASKAC